MPLFPNAAKLTDPEVIVPHVQCGKKEYASGKTKGAFRLVFPRNGREWAAIMLMDLHADRFAPVHGDGIVISERAFQSFQF